VEIVQIVKIRSDQKTKCPQRIRKNVLIRDNYTCRYCGDYAGGIDHVVPLSLISDHHPDNLVACCSRCNSTAGNKLFDSFQEKLKFINDSILRRIRGLRIPIWLAEEYLELGHILRNKIKNTCFICQTENQRQDIARKLKEWNCIPVIHG